MIKAIVASLGGTPQPIIKTILDYEPDNVYFIVSSVSVEQVQESGELSKSTEHIEYEYEVFDTTDPENLVDCYLSSLRAISRAKDIFSPAEILVNYTGGTKCMAAALVLASMDDDFKHCYIGGKIRDEVGRVKTGYEMAFIESSPRIALGVNDLNDAMILFNRNVIGEAEKMLQMADSVISNRPAISKQMRSLRGAVNAYLKWDRFDHVAAKRILDECDLDIFDVDTKDTVESNKTILYKLLERSKGGTELCMELVLDIISNANRRAEEGHYDDAIARLYRALEMIGQYRLKENGYDASDMKIDDEDLKKRYELDDGTIKLSLVAVFTFLRDLGDEWGQIFMEEFDGFKKHLGKRTLSIFAHGTETRSKEDYLRFKMDIKKFIEACGIEYTEIEFPEFPEDIARRIFR
jgi:CRISPR-associated protein (TIGR02710 family)